MAIINSVIAGGGTTPTGTISITSNGTHDVTNYATADVNVPTTAPALYREFQLDANGVLQPNTTTTHIMDFTGVKSISAYALINAYYDNTQISGAVDMSDLIQVSGEHACENMFRGCTSLTSVDLSSLTAVGSSYGCSSMFQGCTGLTNVDLSSLTTVSVSACENMFYGCTGLTSINLSSLKAVSGTGLGRGCRYMFSGCASLTSVDLSSLTTVSSTNSCSSMFSGCASLTSVDLSSLTTVSGSSACDSMFFGCTNLTSLSFPSITPNSFSTRVNQFLGMCQNISNITLHFPSNTQAKIETLTGYSATAPFGAVAGTVLFDLPATNTLTGADSNTYSRNPKYDTATSLAWKVGAYGTTNFTPAYYTSGTTDPAVSDAIYSDAACQNSITTITAIS